MESAYATIEIGGTLRWADIDQFVAAAVEDYCLSSHSDVGDERGIREDIESAAEEKRPIRFYGESVPYAEFDGLELLCQKLGLAYKRHSDPIFDAGCQISFWKPGLDRVLDLDACDQQPVFTVRQIRDLISEGTLADKLEEFDEIIKFPFPLVLEGSMADEPTAADTVEGQS